MERERESYSKRVQDYPALVKRVQELPEKLYDVQQHGALSIDPDRYPLYSVRTHYDSNKPTIILSALNHGHEANGGEALIRQLENQDKISELFEYFNVVAIPCINPWGYEYGSRRNPDATDINRDFESAASETEEAAFVKEVLDEVKTRGDNVAAGNDQHETYFAKDTEFRKETADLDGTPLNETPVARQSHIMTGDNPEDRRVGVVMIAAMGDVGADIVPDGQSVVASGSKGGLVVSQSDLTLRAYCARLFPGAVCFSSEIVPKIEDATDEQAIKEFDAMNSGMVHALKPAA